MNASFLFLACPGCTLETPHFFVGSLIVGGPIVCFVLLRPYVTRIKKYWGWPRFQIADFTSLFLLLIWPLVLSQSALSHIPKDRIVFATTLLIACVILFWVRLLWLLQQNSVLLLWKRALFVGLIIPLLLILGTILGWWAGAILLGLTFSSIDLMLIATILCGLIGAPVYFCLACALRCVFNEPAVRPMYPVPDRNVSTIRTQMEGCNSSET